MRRPSSLAEVAAWTKDSREFSFHFADFLDQFYLERRCEMLSEEPLLLARRMEGGDVEEIGALELFANPHSYRHYDVVQAVFTVYRIESGRGRTCVAPGRSALWNC